MTTDFAACGGCGSRQAASIDPRISHWSDGSAEENFGDFLSSFFGETMLHHARVDADVYHLVGSVIDGPYIWLQLRDAIGSLEGRIAFWRCGTRSPQGVDQRLRERCMFLGVRGPLTRDALGLPSDTVLGDPGLLLPILHDARADPRTAGRTICIPHIMDRRDREELRAMAGTDLLVWPGIDPSVAALRELIDQIVSADFVLSASLHGAILAAAYGRPFAFWDNGHLDVPFKWSDFALSAGIEARFHPDLSAARAAYAEEIAPRLRLPALTPMLDVCPFGVAPWVLLRALAHDGALSPAAAAPGIAALQAWDQAVAPRRARHLARAIHDRNEQLSLAAGLRRARARWVERAKARLRRERVT